MYYFGNFDRTNRYNHENAVRYALTYALNPNPEFKFIPGRDDGGGDCTNFISQCLKAGGAPLAFDSSPWWYRMNGSRSSDDTWSVSWTVAHSLYWTLKVRNQSRLRGLKAKEVNDIQLLELGDIIQYEDKSGRIYHSAMVTAFSIDKGGRVPLISQHSYNLRNATHVKEKAKKMHFMKIEVS
ncbi:amidase domain-containing protein [Clostridium swellfunianum]|uniref:amidase domain-containing protein n=1 Tax=Clostridium swellfunianum TaxID=1367462 RepID=UPI00202EF0F5|nr:amidase domain-containing protein [Clostridium swellfunianum]MCM0646947.1 amidase domain-containing protein [Clostridium swellfunianum]